MGKGILTPAVAANRKNSKLEFTIIFVFLARAVLIKPDRLTDDSGVHLDCLGHVRDETDEGENGGCFHFLCVYVLFFCLLN